MLRLKKTARCVINISGMKKQRQKTPFSEYLKKIGGLFLSFLKIGLFSFGGGYTMIAFYEREFVEKKKYIGSDEFSDILVLAESTPGPIAINGATYIGYRTAGVFGAFVSTLATCIPSFVIIYLISLFFDKFLELTYVRYAFRGIQAGVPLLIMTAGWKMLKKMKRTPFNIALFSVAAAVMLCFSIFSIAFSSIYYILIGGAAGLILYFIGGIVGARKKTEPTQPSETSKATEEGEKEEGK